MSWFKSKRGKKRRETDWDFFDGYPPNLRMRRLSKGAWEVRPATEEEMREFLASEAAFVTRPSGPSQDVLSPDKNLPGDTSPRDTKRDKDPGN